ncbi:MAG: acyl-CoA dehydrogenase [Burkholderiaceae bacterium]|nr:MAG: acyl-CoA dehydrogenase [Burkholderiaceae bacterium]
MPFRAPAADHRFILDHVVDFAAVAATDRFAEATPDTVAAILTEAAKMCDDVLAPLNRNGDRHPARLENGVVRASPGYAEGYHAIASGGWIGLAANPAHGGMGLPMALNTAVNEMMSGACLALQLKPLLSQGQIEALDHHASDALKTLYLPKLISGEWSGTMNLTEPQAGSDVGALRSKAEPQGDGTYAVTGQKIYITWGDSDITANVCHLVLARLPDAAPGTRGISLFMVPKYLPDAAGNPGQANSLRVVSLEHKLGIHGSPTCVMQFDGATGWLVGEPNKGLNAMFVMMNGARLGVGMQSLGLMETAYQMSAAYAKERLQMRSLTGVKAPDKPADPIIVHPDVRRMLLTQRAYLEGGRALAYWVALLLDRHEHHEDEDVRKESLDLVALLTPVVKAFTTDNGFQSAVLAQQVFGGHGFIRETGIEQYVRDARINMIYEGTNTIQALDLLGRKVMGDGGAKLRKFGEMIRSLVEEEGTNDDMAEFVNPLADLAAKFEKLSLELGMKAFGNQDEAGAAAVDYLRIVGHVVLSYLWVKMAKVALAHPDDDFYKSTLAVARFYFATLQPETAALMRTARAGAAPLMALEADLF